MVLKIKSNWTLLFLCTLFHFSCQNVVEKIENPATGSSELLTTLDQNKIGYDLSIQKTNHDFEVIEICRFQDHWIVGTEHNGLWISTTSDDLLFKPIGNWKHPQKVIGLYTSKEKIYCSLFDNGLYLSVDKGKNWKNIQYDLPDDRVRGIIEHKGKLIVGCDLGIFILEGKHWKAIFTEGQVQDIKQIATSLYAASVKGVIQSDDSGKTWTSCLAEGTVHDLCLVDGGIIALHVSGDLYYIDEAGERSKISEYSPRSNSYVYDAVSIDSCWYMSNNYGLFYSNDKGKTWDFKLPTQNRFISKLAVDSSLLLVGTRPL